MKKIAIFGDSWADDKINWTDHWLDVGPSWVDYLRNFYQINNFSLGGSCLYYSKKIFDNTNFDQYDHVIFAVTQSQRRYQALPNYSNNSHLLNWNYASSLHRLGSMPDQKTYIETINNFFLYMHNESDDYFHMLMKKDIVARRNDVLLLDYEELIQIDRDIETNHWINCGYSIENYSDARKCHMSEENNLIFGKQLFSCLQTNSNWKLVLSEFTLPTKEFTHYFRKE